MSKVISFKVDDEVYNKLKNMNLSFREIFEPLITQVINNKPEKDEYTSSIPSKINFTSLSIDDVHFRVDSLISKHFK